MIHATLSQGKFKFAIQEDEQKQFVVDPIGVIRGKLREGRYEHPVLMSGIDHALHLGFHDDEAARCVQLWAAMCRIEQLEKHILDQLALTPPVFILKDKP